MIRIIAVLFLFVLIAGCEATPANPGLHPGGVTPSVAGCVDDPAPGPNARITIKYGDSKIEVTHKANVKKNKFLKLTLNPDNSSQEPVEYKTLDVYLFGKDPESQWLNGIYNADGDNQKVFYICADEDPGNYTYMVVIPGVGTIDPRVEIEN